MNHIEEFRDAIAATGLCAPDDIVDDGKIHRFSANGKRGNTSGWYILHGDGIPAGRFGSYGTDIDVKWRQNRTEELTAAQKAEYREKMQAAKSAREAEQIKDRRHAAETAATMWAAAKPGEHPYLTAKGIPAAGARIHGDLLLIPVRHSPTELVGLQRIYPNGQKRFLKGSPIDGGYFSIGKPADTFVICEGYATGVSIHVATGFPVVIAFNAGNLPAVAQKIRARFPDVAIILAADDDSWTEGNPGVTKATEAARAIGARVVVPTWAARKQGSTDFNDLHSDEGLDAVKACFEKAAPRSDTEPGAPSDKAPTKPASGSDVRTPMSENAGSKAAGSLSFYPAGDAVEEPDHQYVGDPGPDVYYFPPGAISAPAIVNPLQEILPAISDEYAPQCSDDDLSSRHIKRMRQNALWSEMWGRWLVWQGDRWVKDETNLVLDLVRQTCREISNDVANNPEFDANKRQRQADKIASFRTITNVERLARTFREVATHPDHWDQDLWALNTPGGVVDLRAGTLRPHSRDDRFTKITHVAPGGSCPTWLNFLRTATAGNDDLIGFLKRMCGYALTGEVREHALFFVYGTGGNGKGTFLNTITHIMGDYQRVSGSETFTENHGDRHTTELARLQGARLVTAQETEEGKRWAESRIKSLTGGDPITARFMRQDDFTFIPQFKLVIVGNHKPAFRNVDEAIKRRLHLIPFTAVIAPQDKDPMLAAKLLAEAPGILSWMIEGCVEWARDGLRPPQVVKESTEEYLDAEDALQQWIDECCVVAKSQFGPSAELFASWSRWCDDTGEFVGSQKRLMARLESRGVQVGQKQNGKRGCFGIALNLGERKPF